MGYGGQRFPQAIIEVGQKPEAELKGAQATGACAPLFVDDEIRPAVLPLIPNLLFVDIPEVLRVEQQSEEKASMGHLLPHRR
ncbi:MAG: hypothetical protein ACI8X5_000947 [Planctomycetota bacterium]|jgi:hypothetical protein